jgi:hypothetical protein
MSPVQKEKPKISENPSSFRSNSAGSSVVEEKERATKGDNDSQLLYTKRLRQQECWVYIGQEVHPLFVRRIALSKPRMVSSGRSKRYRVGLVRSGSASADLGQYRVSPPQPVKGIGQKGNVNGQELTDDVPVGILVLHLT